MVYIGSRPESCCSYCNGELEHKTSPFCKECGHPIHLDCWDGFGGCATAFCVASPGFDLNFESKKAKAAYAAKFPMAVKFCPSCGSERVGVFCGECGMDFVQLDSDETAIQGGRNAEDLLAKEVDAISESPTSLMRSKSYRKTKDCLNCGSDLAGEKQCGRCLYDG